MWKCVVETEELKTYEFKRDGLQVCIEARCTNKFWEIYKTYHSNELTFTEEFEANSEEEASGIITKIQKEVLDEDFLKKIDDMRQNLSIKIKRAYKESDVEKWEFSINGGKFDNIIIARYSYKGIELDIITSEDYKFLESEILDELFRLLGLEDFGSEVIQNMYFFSKKSSFFNEAPQKDLIGKVEVGFRVENGPDFQDDNN